MYQKRNRFDDWNSIFDFWDWCDWVKIAMNTFSASLATIYFCAFDAQTFRNYAESFFYMCYALQSFAWYTMNFFNRFKYAQFFSELDEIIAQSKRAIDILCVIKRKIETVFYRCRKQKSWILFNLSRNSSQSGKSIA